MENNQRIRRKVRNSYIVSTISIALVLFLLGAVGYLMHAAMRVADSLQESVTLIVELENGISDTRKTELKEMLEQNPLTAEVTYISKEEKLNDSEFRKIFAVEFEEVLDENPLLDTYEVRLTALSEERATLDSFIASISDKEGVAHVSYPAELIEQVHATVNKVRPILLAFAAVLLIISLTLLNNTIRLAIFSKRYLINTMKLVGATKWFIIRPFLWDSVKQGIWSGVIAAALFGAMIYGIDRTMPELSSPEQLQTAGILLAGMVVVGVTVSLFFTLFAVNKFVNMKSNKIYLY
ncbi:MAG: permease-like cell division protein FtsX [Alistipes sp.]|nr:permease-like cell division protein FtsX [Alistipes sp.]